MVRRDQLDIRTVLAAVALLTLYPFAVAATHASFWHDRDTPPFIPALAIGLVVALVLRRRWAWALLLFAESVATIRSIATGEVLTAATCALTIALLVSATVRRYVGVGRS